MKLEAKVDDLVDDLKMLVIGLKTDNVGVTNTPAVTNISSLSRTNLSKLHCRKPLQIVSRPRPITYG